MKNKSDEEWALRAFQETRDLFNKLSKQEEKERIAIGIISVATCLFLSFLFLCVMVLISYTVITTTRLIFGG